MRTAWSLARSLVPRSLRSSRFPIVTPAATGRNFASYTFICGLHRSGTTLLENLVHAACDVTVLRATVPENEGQHLQDVYPLAQRHGGPGRFAFAPEMHPDPVTDPIASAHRERLLACWTPWMVGEGSVFLEKSPPNVTKIPWLRSVFPGAQFIVLTRDPRAVAMATARWSRTSLEELIFHWHVAYASARISFGPDCHLVRYEELCADPERVLGELVDKLQLLRRKQPLALPRRFEIYDANAKYLSKFPQRVFASGSWTSFGYSLDSVACDR